MKTLKNWPTLAGHLQFAWQAFNELHRARQVGFDVCPLQVADVMAWMNLNQVDPDERRELFIQITVLDDEWLGHIRTKQLEAADNEEKDKAKGKG